MEARSVCTKTARVVLMLGALLLTATYTSTTNVAEGCGFGFHRSIYGGCIVNHPGPYATPAYYHPGCWRNFWGQLRCR